MDDILRRLGLVESLVAEVRGNVREIKGVLRSLATKADFEGGQVRTGVVRTEVAGLRGDIKALKSSIIRWLVGTAIAKGVLSLWIAKFMH